MLLVLSKNHPLIVDKWKSRIILFLNGLSDDYPDFDIWLSRVFDEVPEGKRVIVLDIADNDIRGLTILKNIDNEKKICTFRVEEKYRNQGIGTNLLKKSHEILDTDKPLITISEKNIETFKPFLIHRGYEMTGSVLSLYQIGKREFFFNQTVS